MNTEIDKKKLEKLEEFLENLDVFAPKEIALDIIEILGLRCSELTKHRRILEFERQKNALLTQISNLEFKYRDIKEEECPF